ncbi:MAG TPA: polyphosphate kinase 2 [Acidimicrobiales bacterium]|nr:polyphosphate kinase 2 [Acidimicrobiales bacterium]
MAEERLSKRLSIGDMEERPPYEGRLRQREYEAELRMLQIELLKLQRHVREEGLRIVILFEGRDAAGKGGTIKRFTENLNPRGGRVVALTKPNETERGQWYFQRYVTHLPTSGEIVMFDRSWYNRAGVERVMGFCTPREYMEFMRQAPGFERSLVNSGIFLFKLWFAVSESEQRARFESRRSDPLRRWKLSPIDEASIDRFGEYTEARDALFFYTDTTDAPWTVINSNEKRRARLESMRLVLHALDYEHKDPDVAHPPDRRVVQPAAALDIPTDHDPLGGATHPGGH